MKEKSLAIICLFTLLLINGPLRPQTINTDSILQTSNYFSVFLTPLLLDKPSFSIESGNMNPWQEHYSLGFSAGMDYSFHISDDLMISAGFGYGLVQYKYRYNLKASEYPFLQGTDYSNKGYGRGMTISRLQFPLTFERKFPISKGTFLKPFLGVNYTLYNTWVTYYGEVILVNDSVSVDLLNFHAESWDKLLNYNIGCGLSRVLPNYNLFQLDLLLNYSPSIPITGEYTLLEGSPYETKGKYTMSGTSLGIKVSYSFTHIRKNVEKIQIRQEGYSSLSNYRHDKRVAKREFARSIAPQEVLQKNALEVSAGANLMFPATYEVLSGHDKPLTYLTMGYNFGLGYLLNFKKSSGLYFGLNFRTMRDNYDVKLEPDPPELKTAIDLNGWTINYWNLLSMSFRAEHRFSTKNPASSWLVQGGLNLEVNLNPYFNYCFESDSMDSFYTAGTSNYLLSLQQDDKLHINPMLSVGKGWVLKNCDILCLKTIFCFSTKVDNSGTFEIYRNSSRNSSGTYNWRSSYVGLDLAYRFVFKGKRYKAAD